VIACSESEEPQVARSFPERVDSAGVSGPAVNQDWGGQGPTLAELIGVLRRDVDTLREERKHCASPGKCSAEGVRRLEKNSSNSSKAPSSDGPKKPLGVFKRAWSKSG
jgi:hypothetical protein